MKNLIFLDIDGVLNCQLFFEYRENKKQLKKAVKKSEISRMEYYAAQICKKRLELFNELCEATDSVVVISSTWRTGKTVEELQEILDYCGATFKIIGKTGHSDSRIRGAEIHQWLGAKCKEIFGVESCDFYRYAIIDDDNDMLLLQASHFFQTDNYSGLTPTTCYKIKRFFTHETF